MRTHPIGTGPFKFVEYKPNESVKLTRNPDYRKKDRPYLDGLEFPIVTSVATRNLMFIADRIDMTLLTASDAALAGHQDPGVRRGDVPPV